MKKQNLIILFTAISMFIWPGVTAGGGELKNDNTQEESALQIMDHEAPFNIYDIIDQVTDWSTHGEFLIDTTVTYVSAPEDQESASIAYDGTNYLIVWSDERERRSGYDIYGVRVNPSGEAIESAGGIVVSSAPGRQANPSIAFDGTNYLVVWEDGRYGFPDIYGARVDPSGHVLDPDGFAISIRDYSQYSPSVAFDGSSYLVVWEDEGVGDSDIYGTRVDPSGFVLDPEGFAISTRRDYQSFPSVAFDGTNYLVVWTHQIRFSDLDIMGARVSPSGIVLEPDGFVISSASDFQYSPAIAFDGTNYLVVWTDRRNPPPQNCDIYGARVSPLGTVIDQDGFAISNAIYDQVFSSVVFDGMNYLVVWSDYRDGRRSQIYGSRIKISGVVLDPDGIPISTEANNQWAPSVAFNDVNYQVVWTDVRDSQNNNIFGARVDQFGTVLDTDGFPISTTVNYQWSPSVAYDGTNYLVVWEDSRNNSSIYGAFIDPSGSTLGPTAILISTSAMMLAQPSVAFDGTNHLIVWGDSRDGNIYGTRVDQSGVVLDPDDIAISDEIFFQWKPSVAFDGTNYLVVWEDHRDDIFIFTDIYGARVSPSGDVLDPDGIAISTAWGDQWTPSIAFDGTNYLVVWGSGDILGSRVDPAGVVLDPDGIVISSAEEYQLYPSVAFDGMNFLVVWEDYRNGNSDIFGARVDPTGNVLDPDGIVITTIANNQLNPVVAFNGVNYQVVWEDERIGLYADIYGATLNPSGVVIDSFSISLQSRDQLSPALANGSGDQCLIAYSGWTEEYKETTFNAMRTWGTFLGAPTGLESGERTNYPKGFYLSQNYPNPFNPSTTIEYEIVERSQVEIKIYDIRGHLIRSLVDEKKEAGTFSVQWNGLNDSGSSVPSGIFFYRLLINHDNVSVKKMLLLK